MNLIVYPIPATDMITVKINKIDIIDYVINITDFQGNLVRSISSAHDLQVIDIQDLANGMYFVNVLFDDGTIINNIITKQ